MAEEMFGRYRLEKLIGRGGMGEVHRAFDTERGRVVALKRLPAALAADPTFQARFRSEAALAARLHEPHVIPIHDFGEIDGQLYIDMRLVEGPDLATLLARDGALAPERAVEIVGQVAAALDAAHTAGLVHRDIKPGNILLTDPHPGDDPDPDRDPEATAAVTTRASDFVYVADFGIARATDSGTTGSLTATGTTVGSLDYVAPERFSTRGDHRADIYALGCVLYEALTAQRPFPVEGLPAIINAHLNTPPPAPSVLRPDLPAGLDAVVARAMAKDPDARFRSAGALAEAARGALLDTSPPTVDSWRTVFVTADVAPAGAASPVPVQAPATAYVAAWPASVPAVGGHVPRRQRAMVLAALATVVVIAAAFLVTQLLRPGTDSNEVLAEPFGYDGTNPFMPPAAHGPPRAVPPVRTRGPVNGATPGLYGGTMSNALCDREQMISFLQSHPDKARAWADVEGISTAQIPSYIRGLTPVVLRTDTAVTNHGFASGKATAFNSIMQAGTAVLVDHYGVPRARCMCGNPLTPAVTPSAPSYSGQKWSGFNPANVITVDPSPSRLTQLTVVDPISLVVFSRPIGSGGGLDQPQEQPSPPTNTPSPTPDSPPVPRQAPAPPAQPQPAPQQPAPQQPAPEQSAPQQPAPRQEPSPDHPPEITSVSSYTEGVLVYLRISYRDQDGDAVGFGFVGVNESGWGRETHPFSSPSYGRVAPGRVDYPFNHACGEPNQYESDVKAWIYDEAGHQSVPIVAHLTCT
ncbi:MAG: protein kinase [Pseudonocardia sp.]|nr:protein kinase [Pseudonocardia sp.]